jgi:hypothetical protein
MARAEQPQDWKLKMPRPWLSLDALVPVVHPTAENNDEHRMLGSRETTPQQIPDSHIPPYLLDPEPMTTEGEI